MKVMRGENQKIEKSMKNNQAWHGENEKKQRKIISVAKKPAEGIISEAAKEASAKEK